MAMAVVNSRSASPVSTVETRILLMLPRLPGITDSFSFNNLAFYLTAVRYGIKVQPTLELFSEIYKTLMA